MMEDLSMSHSTPPSTETSGPRSIDLTNSLKLSERPEKKRVKLPAKFVEVAFRATGTWCLADLIKAKIS